MKSYLKYINGKEIINIYLWYFLTIFVVYFLPFSVSKMYMWLILIPLIITKRHYFWIAFFFLLIESPGFLFDSFDKIHKLELYGIGLSENRGIYYQEIVYLIMLFKAFLEGVKFKSNFKKIYIVFILVEIILILIGIFYGLHGNRIFLTIRSFIPFTLFFSLSILMYNYDNYIRFFRLIFPFIFFIVLVQTVELFLGEPIAMTLGGIFSYGYQTIKIDPYHRVARSLYSYYYILLISIGTLYFINLKKQIFSGNYLALILCFSFFSFFFSATRGYLLSLTVMLFLSQLIHKETRKITAKIVLIISITGLLILSQPLIREQTSKAVQRLSTLKYVAQGDLTAGGTSIRTTERGGPVMNEFSKSLLYGWGYSNNFWDYADPHVGHQTMLLHSGILGYSIYWGLMIAVIVKILTIINKLDNKNIYKNSLYVFIVGIFGLFVVHSTSNIIFSYTCIPKEGGLPLAFAFLFVLCDKTIYEARNKENS